jgi:hypothetical protein
MSITQIVLFISSLSKNCVPCLQFIQNQRLPIQVVRLDTEESRDIAIRGKNFSIISVPTLVVLYLDGDMQMYVGTPKIISWLQRLILAQQRQMQEQQEYRPSPSKLQEYDDPEEPAIEYIERKPERKVTFVDNDSEDDEIPRKQKEVPRKAKKNSKKKIKQKTVLEFADDETHEQPVFGSGKKNGKNAAMGNLIRQAKEMEKERQRSLGYREEDLPRHGH